MTRRKTWLVLGILTLLLAAGLAGWALGRAAALAGAPGTAVPAETTAAREEDPAETSASPYHASDPALLAATGRPQLVEFYHRL